MAATSGFLKFAFLGRVETPRDPKIDELTKENEQLRRKYQNLVATIIKQSRAETEAPAKSRSRADLELFATVEPPKPKGRATIKPDLAPPPPPPPAVKEVTQATVVMLVTWAMVIVLALSLVGIVTLTILDKKSPDILTIGVSSPLGYFGGLLSAYFGVQNK